MNCKKEPKTKTIVQTENENTLGATVAEMWGAYTTANPEFKNEATPESDFFHNNKKDADRLARLTLNEKKSASSGLYALYQHYNVELPKVGKKQIITDFEGNAIVIIETVGVDTIPFNKVSKEYATFDMGTDDEPLEKWKKAHWDFYEGAMSEIEKKPTEDELVVCERFKKIWPKNE